MAWFAAFGVQVDANDRLNCGSIWRWGSITDDTYCGRWKAAQAFSFLSAIVWIVSALVVSTSGTQNLTLHADECVGHVVYLPRQAACY